MDLVTRYASAIREMLAHSNAAADRDISPDNVFQEAHLANRPRFFEIVQGLVLPGSGLLGGENLLELGRLSAAGKSCILFPAHLSNFDVPQFWGLAKLAGPAFEEIFERVVFVAGRKLNEESAVVKMFTEMFTRLVISPKTHYDGITDPAELARAQGESRAINLAAHRRLKQLRHEGRIFLVFPTGTRYRPWDESTGRGLREVEGYLRAFEYFVPVGVRGNLMPPSQSGMEGDIPTPGRVVMHFGPVTATQAFRESCLAAPAAASAPDEKQYFVDCLMARIRALSESIPAWE